MTSWRRILLLCKGKTCWDKADTNHSNASSTQNSELRILQKDKTSTHKVSKYRCNSSAQLETEN